MTAPAPNLGRVRPSSRVATVPGEDVARGQVDRSDQAWQRFTAWVDLGARWAALILFVVMVVAQTVKYLSR